MEIKLDIKVPHDNTNSPHGNIVLETDNRYTYISAEDNTIAVDADELFKAINALYKK